jgi:hypothetical protein
MTWTPYRIGGWPAPDVRYRVARTAADLADFGHWLGQRHDHLLGLDCETNAYDPHNYRFRLRTVQVADLHESWVIPVWSSDGRYSRGEALSAMLRGHPRFAAWYSENEVQFLTRDPSMRDAVRLGDQEPHIVDGQAVLSVADPRTVTTFNAKDRIDPRIPRSSGLKETTTRELTPCLEELDNQLHAVFRDIVGEGRRSAEKLMTYGYRHVPIDHPVYEAYAAMDPLCALRLVILLMDRLSPKLRARARAATVEQWMVDQAIAAGLQVDGPYAEWLDGVFAEQQRELAAELEPYGVAASGLGAGVGKAFKALGVAPTVKRNGSESYDKERLEEITATAEAWLGALPAATVEPAEVDLSTVAHVERVCRLASNVAQARKVSKYRGTWVGAMLRTVREGDGAMHGRMRAAGTVTRRMTYRKTETAGPMHSAPKRSTTLLRAAVRARRGHVLVSADFSQAEPFVMAAGSGDRQYLADLQAGDINSVTAALVYGDAYNPAEGKVSGTPSYGMRQRGKATFLACC